MNKARLLKLAALLTKVDPKNFDMSTWARAKRSAARTPQCCTKACALGWATAIPEFNKAGLRLVADEWAPQHGEVHFGELQDFEAAEAFFRLTDDESIYLFCEGSGEPAKKAEEIRAFVRRGGVPVTVES